MADKNKDYRVELTELSNGQKVDSRIYPYLQEMFDAARKDGIYPVVREGYRTYEEQQKILDDKIKAYINEGYSQSRAERTAKEWVALPGTSEHQLGIAVDINADKSKSSNDEVYTWLAANAHNYGFILRYPQGKQEITGTSYEPWHYRYVGVDAAREIYETLDEDDYIEEAVEKEEYQTGGGVIHEGSRNNTLSLFAGKVLKKFGITDKAHDLFLERAAK